MFQTGSGFGSRFNGIHASFGFADTDDLSRNEEIAFSAIVEPAPIFLKYEISILS